MLLVAIAWIVFAFMMMDVPIDIPSFVFVVLKVIYKIYPIIMIGLFVFSFFVKSE